ncbi:hypothetical protein HDF09_003808 [Edaphobacter lichenicola]|uniref:Uncharacterized protein n=1 Tax=Tunturiibacter empetritectus TaxID=3069691 RepID=A0A7W8MUB3_9BACT|nr:hypothetical protein [Edaphobacter lichenicola]
MNVMLSRQLGRGMHTRVRTVPSGPPASSKPPVVNPQSMMTIRKFTSHDFTMEDLILRMLSTEQGATAHRSNPPR